MRAWSRPPLAPPAFRRLRPGAIRAHGWLGEQLRLAAEGLAGALMDVWPDVGPESGWLGGPGERGERGPYYARGLTALAYALGAPPLVARARRWLAWARASQRPDGFFGPAGDDDWWSRMPMLEALRLHHEASGDGDVLPFMLRYFRHQRAHLPARPLEAWGRPRGGDNLDHVLWCYEQTGETFLLELADLLRRQTSDWVAELGGGRAPSDGLEFAHGVNRAMGLKAPAVWYQRSRDPAHLAAIGAGWARTLAHHGQIQGTFSCDEMLHGTGSTQGAELCAIVELLASFERVLAIGGAPWLADAIERLAFNALPAIVSADHRAHQYFQLPNQVACTPGPHNFWIHHENDLLFGPATGYGCCTANMHLAWPELVNHLWLATPEGGLAALVLGPCAVTAAVEGRHRVTIEEDTAYPFDDEIRFTLRTSEPVAFPLLVRIPGWATRAAAAVNGERVPVDAPLLRLARAWRDGDTVELRLPMDVRLSGWERGAVGVERGPLVYALRIGEDWRPVGGLDGFPDYEVRPTTPWNYGLCVQVRDPAHVVRVEHGPRAAQPWAADGAGVRLRVPGRRLPGWGLEHDCSAPIPAQALAPPTRAEMLTLVPFGCARLRIAMFPVTPQPKT